MHDYDPFCYCAECCEQEADLTARISGAAAEERARRQAYAPEPELQLAVVPSERYGAEVVWGTPLIRSR